MSSTESLRGGCEVFYQNTALHDENCPSSGSDVQNGIAIEGDDIGIHAWSDGSYLIAKVEGLRGKRGD
jgi:hypothetical protein